MERFLKTLTGQIIALTTLVGAVSGLLVAIKQLIPSVERTPIRAVTPQPSNSGNQSSTTTVPSTSQSLYSIGSEVTVKHFTFKIAAAKLDDHKKENPTLRFTIQITNEAVYNSPIDDKVCRLIVDGIARAPINGWVAMAYAHSTLSEDFIFPFPTETKSAALKFWAGDESETISVNLPSN